MIRLNQGFLQVDGQTFNIFFETFYLDGKCSYLFVFPLIQLLGVLQINPDSGKVFLKGSVFLFHVDYRSLETLYFRQLFVVGLQEFVQLPLQV